MTSKPLSESAIKAAAPGDVLKDHQVPGLQLRAFPQSKAFYLYFRTKAGVQRKPKLGEYGQLTLASAREVARTMLAEVALGKDPTLEREQARAEPTLDELFAIFDEKHLSRPGFKSTEKYKANYKSYLQPKFGTKKLSHIGHGALEDAIHAIGDARPKGDGHPMAANRILSLASKMFNFARVKVKWKGENPAHGIEPYPEVKRRRYMKGDEAHKLAEIFAREAERNPAPVAFLYLLILTGARRGEIANARWEWIKGNVLELPDHKSVGTTNAPKSVYLPPPALEVLDKLPRTPGATITGLKNPSWFWYRVRAEAGCPDLRIHDLRHSFASAAISAGLSLAQIGELLGHTNQNTTKRYAHLIEEAALAATTATADKIMERMKVNA